MLKEAAGTIGDIKKQERGKSHFSFFPSTPYPLYKQRGSLVTRRFWKDSPAPPLFIEEVDAKQTEEFLEENDF